MPYKNVEDAKAYDREYKKRTRAKNRQLSNKKQATYKRTRYANDPEYRAAVLAHNRKQRATAIYMVRGAKKRAFEKGVPYALTVADAKVIQKILDAGVCQITRIPFERTAGDRHHFAPSLDRIRPELGYVPGNIRVVVWCLNAALGHWGEAVLLRLARAIVDAAPAKDV